MMTTLSAVYLHNMNNNGSSKEIKKYFQDKANFIWQVADDILRGVFKQHEYGDVIL